MRQLNFAGVLLIFTKRFAAKGEIAISGSRSLSVVISSDFG